MYIPLENNLLHGTSFVVLFFSSFFAECWQRVVDGNLVHTEESIRVSLNFRATTFSHAYNYTYITFVFMFDVCTYMYEHIYITCTCT